MKNAIYQYWFGDEPRESALVGQANMKKYAKMVGADYIYYRDPEFFGGPCERQKMYSSGRPIYDDAFLQYDKVMYIDMDIFAVENCTENIFEEDIKHIGICPEIDQPRLRDTSGSSNNSYINNKNDNKWADVVKKEYNVSVNRDSKNRPLVYNAGMMIYTREGLIQARKKFTQFQKHIDYMKRAGFSGFYLSDQTYYGTMLHVSGVDFKMLDTKWNSQLHWIRNGNSKSVNDRRKPDTNFVHVQISGADDWGESEHYQMVNLPPSLWNIPTEFDL